jgi:hypothetical protein
MDRQPVSSSNLASIGYEFATKTLEIEFTNGTIYQYADVPADVHARLMGAASHGKFFNANVKKGGYAVQRVS